MPNCYPQFSDGNVEIHLSGRDGDKLILHSHVLALHSPWSKASLSERWNSGGAPSDSNRTNRRVYELCFDKDDSLGLLTRRVDDANAQPGTSKFIIDLSADLPCNPSHEVMQLHKQRLGLMKVHRDMLGTLYHLVPQFSHSCFDSARASILMLSIIAEAYGCSHVAKVHIQNHLHLLRTEILDRCASNSILMLELAMSVKSDWIFMEAATHLIGRCKTTFDKIRPHLSELKVVELFDKKRTEFINQLRECELAIIKLPPPGTGRPEQVAVDFLRQWLAVRLGRNLGSQLVGDYAAVYRDISLIARCPFRRADTRKEYAAYSSKLLGRLGTTWEHGTANGTALQTVFTRAADVLKPIMRAVTRIQSKSWNPDRALKCMSIGEDELHWKTI